MKLISQFKNEFNNITYSTYQLKSGMKLLHLDNPATNNFDLAVIHKAGSAYESLVGVPNGTAHYLEHMLLNPNSKFKSKDEINRFEQGSINRPAIVMNAFTSRRHIAFTGNGHEEGKYRILERISSIYEFPKRKFSNQMEKERGIILAEKSRKLKKENDNYLMSLDFLFKGIQDEFTGDVLGEPEEIHRITVDDLERYFIKRFTHSNTVISIQSKGELDTKCREMLENLSNLLPRNSIDGDRDIELINRYRVGAFSEKRASGVSISFIYFQKDSKKIDYKKRVKEYIVAKLLSWLTFEILREKNSLIYSFSPFRNSELSFNHLMYGYRFTTEKEKISNAINQYYNILYEETFKFLRSKKGKEWFEDVISTYIFPKTASYDEALGDDIAPLLIDNREIFNYNIAAKTVKKIKISDIKDFLKERLDIPPHIWIEGDMSKKELINIVNSSSFNKRFNTV